MTTEPMATAAPRFSICIPSRNRLEAVKQTVQSVVAQGYDNWEIVISDNSTQSRGALAEWVAMLALPQDKIRVVDAGGDLQMDENWESATRPARGEYILVVADRWQLRNGILQVFSNIVDRFDPDLFFWAGTKPWQFEALFTAPGVPPPLKISKSSTDEILGAFLNFRGFETESVYGQAIPRALNGAYKRDLGDKARAIWGELFRPISPDYTSAMAFLLLGQSCIKIHEMMYTPIKGAGSNFSNTSVLGLGHYLKTFPNCHVWRGLDEDIVFSTVLNDVENTLKATEKGRAWITRMNVENALKCMMSELNFKEFNGSLLPVGKMREAIYALAAREELSEQQIANLETYVSGSRHRAVESRRWLRRFGLYDQARSLNDRLRHSGRKTRIAGMIETEDVAARGIEVIA
ncbi:MAG: glycosyltransferase family 2 protein [Paracoccaceae bacterium]